MKRNGGAVSDIGKGGGGGTEFVAEEGTTAVVRVRTAQGWRTLGGAHDSVEETSEDSFSPHLFHLISFTFFADDG
ncbi:hypothetical protein U1Q18_034472 [Sarracenia purpurea var. burkii]